MQRCYKKPTKDLVFKKNIGCDSKAVMKILTHRSSAQREQIKIEYRRLTGKVLQLKIVSIRKN